MEPRDSANISENLIASVAQILGDEGKCVGILHGILRDAKGKIIDEQVVLNQFQTLGKQHVADCLADRGEAEMGWMAIGTGTGQGVGDNTLANEAGAGAGARQALSPAKSHAANVVTYHRIFAAGEGTGIIVEAGVFNHVSAGDMFVYDDAINFTKAAGASLELTWTFTVN